MIYIDFRCWLNYIPFLERSYSFNADRKQLSGHTELISVFRGCFFVMELHDEGLKTFWVAHNHWMLVHILIDAEPKEYKNQFWAHTKKLIYLMAFYCFYTVNNYFNFQAVQTVDQY